MLTELNALMICPNRELAQQFLRSLNDTRAFQILADLKNYPLEQTLDIRFRQLKPDVLLVDVATNLDAACEIIRFAAACRPVVHAVGLHTSNDSEAILKTLRQGATEFLCAPFEPAMQREAISRIRRLLQPEGTQRLEAGKILVFSSAKPGAGASTLATQCAFAVRKLAGKRVLLADFDLQGGSIGFLLKVNHPYSLVDALQHADRMDPALWSSLTVDHGGVDVLPVPGAPQAEVIDSQRLHDVLEYARLLYDYVVLDLPAIFHRASLMAVSESDRAFLVTTPELPSLHLTRKAIVMLERLGISKDRFHVVVNRVGKRDGITGSDMEKIFNCQVHATLPNDYFSLHRVVTLGQALSGDSELGKAVEGLAGKLAGSGVSEKRRAGAMVEAKPALSET
jgi:pilus assembly protein CpaE